MRYAITLVTFINLVIRNSTFRDLLARGSSFLRYIVHLSCFHDVNVVNATQTNILEQYQRMASLNPESRSYTLATDREKLTMGIFNRRLVSDVRSVHASRLHSD